MSNSRSANRSLEEWMALITECRQSGLSDAAWCEQQGISVSSFYNAATRLRKKACLSFSVCMYAAFCLFFFL